MDVKNLAAAAVAAVLPCVAIACSKGQAAGTADAGSGSLPVFHPETPNPLTVTAIADSSHAATATIPADGGTLSATGADGTTYTLTVPGGALIQDTDVTMTPVSAISGLPLSGGLQAAVQLQPEGLQLYQLATLTIVPDASVAPDRQMSFAYQGNGSEFHLQPIHLGSAIVFDRAHFSGYGVPLSKRESGRSIAQ